MKPGNHIITLCLFIIICSNSFAQSLDLLDSVPTTREGFIKSEKNVLATIDWLENTPLDLDQAKHKSQYLLFTEWITKSPTVTIEVRAEVLTFTDKNSELIMFFMAGWTRYSLQNNYSKDIIKGSTAGIRCAMKVYKKGNGLKKDKAMEKLIVLENKGELEEWVTKQLANK